MDAPSQAATQWGSWCSPASAETPTYTVCVRVRVCVHVCVCVCVQYIINIFPYIHISYGHMHICTKSYQLDKINELSKPAEYGHNSFWFCECQIVRILWTLTMSFRIYVVRLGTILRTLCQRWIPTYEWVGELNRITITGWLGFSVLTQWQNEWTLSRKKLAECSQCDNSIWWCVSLSRIREAEPRSDSQSVESANTSLNIHNTITHRVLLCSINPRVKKIRNEASSCESFATALRARAQWRIAP